MIFEDDMTWCINESCDYTDCFRNIKNRVSNCRFVSVADFSETDTCPKNKTKE